MLTRGIDGPASYDGYRARGLSPDEKTLAGILSDEGYETAAVVAGPWLKKLFGLNLGFKHYDDSDIKGASGRRADSVTRSAIRRLDKLRRTGHPYFLFLNYFDPHSDYDPPEPFRKRFLGNLDVTSEKSRDRIEKMRRLYDGEIAFMDHQIEVLLRQMQEWDLLERTRIIVTSDHGELLGEKNTVGHGAYLLEQLIHVPLLIRDFRPAAGEIIREDRIQLTDLFSLLQEDLGGASESGKGAITLPTSSKVVFAEVYPLQFISRAGDWRILISNNFKFHWNDRGSHMMFGLNADPGERINLARFEKETATRLEETLTRFHESLPAPGAAPPPTRIDDETLEALEALGYLE